MRITSQRNAEGGDMFRNLNAELARTGKDKKAFVDITGLSYKSVRNKCSGKTKCQLKEMLVTKKTEQGTLE